MQIGLHSVRWCYALRMFLSKSTMAALERAFWDAPYAKAKARLIEPYVKSRTLRQHYAYFVWQLGAGAPSR